MKIVPLKSLGAAQWEQAAQMLYDEMPQGWPTIDDARQELREICEKQFDGEPELLAALASEEVIGWVGILPDYGGRVWEIHPLVVRGDHQGRGIGRVLMIAIEEVARARGGQTISLGTDDETSESSLSGVDLYDDLPQQLRDFEPGRHPSAFYMKLGYRLVGVMPDANGPGKPDIFMAKRL